MLSLEQLQKETTQQLTQMGTTSYDLLRDISGNIPSGPFAKSAHTNWSSPAGHYGHRGETTTHYPTFGGWPSCLAPRDLPKGALSIDDDYTIDQIEA
jgi:hypothetical protein